MSPSWSVAHRRGGEGVALGGGCAEAAVAQSALRH
eukprot:CAMPEP_0202079190 /NCGR_PEP_ID=MMETSP0964-20121228/6346_1 /ASSEMBLY_ACC=CAM_ASM_000500 /TAXON_ID=4773 /ORGANISM="Schizochytrium aggregatum, Strain ATCC28209" /LENGTH=34 /DNA_ID= /DNA_START= /DNA_END= /DNA_ORIENTATION=